jgi:hypothetical protein
VQEALDKLRSKLPQGERIDFSELVVLGAQAKARRLSAEEEATDEALKRLVEMVRTRSIPVDVEAAGEVKRIGLIAKYE